jgi:hypothetical protein
MFLVHSVEIIQAHIEDFPKKHARDERMVMGFVTVSGLLYTGVVEMLVLHWCWGCGVGWVALWCWVLVLGCWCWL